MHNPFARLRFWQRPARQESELVVPYAVVCACGRLLQGVRQRRHQIVPCSACGQSVFIFPSCPFSLPTHAQGIAVGEQLSHHRPAIGSMHGAWRWPLAAATFTAALVVAVYLVILPRWQRSVPDATPFTETPQLRQRIEVGRQKLADGRFRTALEEFNAALQMREQRPDALPSSEHRQLLQLHRQSDLLARLLSSSLQEILQKAIHVRHEDEWQARFNDDYRGKAVVFDDVVRREPDGRPMLNVYEIRVGEEKARLALEDLTLFEQLPLDPPRRLLFGARLAGLSREKGGRWVYRFQPDSGVLLTDPGAVATCGLAPLDAELLELLRRQEEWLAQ